MLVPGVLPSSSYAVSIFPPVALQHLLVLFLSEETHRSTQLLVHLCQRRSYGQVVGVPSCPVPVWNLLDFMLQRRNSFHQPLFLLLCFWAAFCLLNALIPSLTFCPFHPFSIRVAYQGGLDAENTRESGLPPSCSFSFAS